MTPNPINIKTKDKFLIEIEYDNGELRTFDMKPYLNKGRFNELKDVSVFNSARISFDTIEWPNGIDIDPETLYSNSVPTKEEV